MHHVHGKTADAHLIVSGATAASVLCKIDLSELSLVLFSCERAAKV